LSQNSAPTETEQKEKKNILDGLAKVLKESEKDEKVTE
jgi:hypothetical protein